MKDPLSVDRPRTAETRYRRCDDACRAFTAQGTDQDEPQTPAAKVCGDIVD